VTDDPFALFEDLPDRYPGGRKPRRTGLAEPGPVATAIPWDDNPKIIISNGVRREFFTIGHLAAAMGGRSPVTIRSWEDKKWLPKARYRTKRPDRSTLPDKQAAGRRLYTREQIEVVIAAADKAGVLDPECKSPNWSVFTQMVVDGWRALK
jgi:hypothetical protein